MAYKKIELVEPIYELQEKETPRQHYFADLYYEVEDDNITKFIKSFTGLKKGQIWNGSGSEIKLECNPPKKSTFEQWASCLQFRKRRKAYWKDKFHARREKRKQKGELFLDTFQDNLEQDIRDNYQIANDIKDHDTLYPHLKAKGKTDVSNANSTNWQIYKEITGVDITEQSSNLNVNMDATVDNRITVNLLEKMKKKRDELDDLNSD